MHNNTTTPPGRNRFRPFRARLAPGGNIQVRWQLPRRAKGAAELPDVGTEMSLQLSPLHARLLHGALGEALEEAEVAALGHDDTS